MAGIVGIQEDGSSKSFDKDGKMNLEVATNFVNQMSIGEPLRSEFLSNRTKESFSNLADLIVNNKMVEIAQASSRFQPKGIEAVAAVLGSPQISVGVSAQRLNNRYIPTDAQIMNAVIDNNGAIKTNKIRVTENADGESFTYHFQKSAAVEQFLQQNPQLGTVVQNGNEYQLTSKKAYDITMHEQYSGQELKTQITALEITG